MTLKTVHAVLVSLSSLLAFLLAGWSFRAFGEESDATYAVMAGGSALAGVGLIVYVVWFWRKITTQEEERRRRRKNIHSVPVALAVCLLGNRIASACTVCYGEAQGPMIEGARLGVWMLFATILVMQLSFGLFFVYLWRRVRKVRGKTIPPWWFEK